MKQIGRTRDGQHIVTMTQDEARAFALLTEAAQRRVINTAYPSDVMLDTNLTRMFMAVRMWIEQADTVNQLQGAIDRMRKALGMQDERACACDPATSETCSEYVR